MQAYYHKKRIDVRTSNAVIKDLKDITLHISKNNIFNYQQK